MGKTNFSHIHNNLKNREHTLLHGTTKMVQPQENLHTHIPIYIIYIRLSSCTEILFIQYRTTYLYTYIDTIVYYYICTTSTIIPKQDLLDSSPIFLLVCRLVYQSTRYEVLQYVATVFEYQFLVRDTRYLVVYIMCYLGSPRFTKSTQ